MKHLCIAGFIILATGCAHGPNLEAEANTNVYPVRLTEVDWHGTGCYKIEMPMGKVYFEKDKGVSGFKSFIDSEGNDWVASYLPPGPNGDFRGFPNSVGNFGHAGRDSGSVTTIVDGKTQGEKIILESSNPTFTFRYHFLADRVAIEVLKSKGDYNFLLETVAGGTADAEDYFVTADGKKRIPTQSGELHDFTPEWVYIGDPKVKSVLFFGKTPDDDAPNENHRQFRPDNIHNMDLYGFGRTGAEHKYQTYGMSGNQHLSIIGFTSAKQSHNSIAAMIEGFLAQPFRVGAEPLFGWSNQVLQHSPLWYASDLAQDIADSVIQYQSYQGGWPEHTDLTRAPLTPGDIPTANECNANVVGGDATVLALKFLALVSEATSKFEYRAAFTRGVDYLLAAQTADGTWPYYWPDTTKQGCPTDTMTHTEAKVINSMLTKIAKAESPYSFTQEKLRKRVQKAGF